MARRPDNLLPFDDTFPTDPIALAANEPSSTTPDDTPSQTPDRRSGKGFHKQLLRRLTRGGERSPRLLLSGGRHSNANLRRSPTDIDRLGSSAREGCFFDHREAYFHKALSGIERLERIFSDCRKDQQLVFLGFVVHGFPSMCPSLSMEILFELERSGVDVIEVGIPFSDPVADGPTIQAASAEALGRGATLSSAFAVIEKARRAGLRAGVILMGYWNPILAYGVDQFCLTAANVGVDGLIVVDLPFDSALHPMPNFAFSSSPTHSSFEKQTPAPPSPSFYDLCLSTGLALIPLIAPTTSFERLLAVVSSNPAFIYCVSVVGTTGAMAFSDWKIKAEPRIKELVALMSKASQMKKKTVPLVAGFGISSPSQVSLLSEIPGVDGFVIGSGLIERIARAPVSHKGMMRNIAHLVKRSWRQHESSRQSNKDEAILAAIAEFCAQFKERAIKSQSQQLPAAAQPSEERDPADSNAVEKDHLSETNGGSKLLGPAEQFPMAPQKEDWFYGGFGGRFLPETLMEIQRRLDAEFRDAMADSEFCRLLDFCRREYIGGPTPLHFAERLSTKLGGGRIYLKREELAFTGSHKINNALGQVLLAKRMGKTRIVAETGAGQHGVATATICAFFGLECVIFMGRVDMERQKLNVFRMRILGARVVPVTSGSQTLKDAVNEALRDAVANVATTHYLVGSAIGPHPYPEIVKWLQSVIGTESRSQMLKESPYENGMGPGTLPNYVVACVGGGSNAMGVFSAFLGDGSVNLVGVEAGGNLPRLGMSKAMTIPSLEQKHSKEIDQPDEKAEDREAKEREAEDSEKREGGSVGEGMAEKPEGRTQELSSAVAEEVGRGEKEEESNTDGEGSLARSKAETPGSDRPDHSDRGRTGRLSQETRGARDEALHCATLTKGRPGVFHGAQTYLLQDVHGQIVETASISAGLDYPGVGPELAHLKETGRVSFTYATDTEALEAVLTLAQTEGIVMALESAHAVAWALRECPTMSKDEIVLVNISGRGDKDMHTLAQCLLRPG